MDSLNTFRSARARRRYVSPSIPIMAENNNNFVRSTVNLLTSEATLITSSRGLTARCSRSGISSVTRSMGTPCRFKRLCQERQRRDRRPHNHRNLGPGRHLAGQACPPDSIGDRNGLSSGRIKGHYLNRPRVRFHTNWGPVLALNLGWQLAQPNSPDYSPGCLSDVRTKSTRFAQHHNLRRFPSGRREVVTEPQDPTDIRTPEPVDGLVGITNRDESGVSRSQRLQELDLGGIGVLILVDVDRLGSDGARRRRCQDPLLIRPPDE